MGINNFIESLVNSDLAFTEGQLIALKDCCGKLKKVLDDIYSTKKSDVSRRTYTSKISFEVLQSYRLKTPDEFYNFRYNDVSISIIKYSSYFYVKSYGFSPTAKSIQTVVDSKVFCNIDLFSETDVKEELNERELKKLVRPDCVLYGGYDVKRFDDIVIIFNTLVSMFLNQINV